MIEDADSFLSHSVPWHAGMSCEDYDKRLAEDPHVMANTDYLQRNTKQCPSCERPIEKLGGCDHMTCALATGGCGHEFCWRCLAPYDAIVSEGNHRHATTCTYYTPFDAEAEQAYQRTLARWLRR